MRQCRPRGFAYSMEYAIRRTHGGPPCAPSRYSPPLSLLTSSRRSHMARPRNRSISRTTSSRCSRPTAPNVTPTASTRAPSPSTRVRRCSSRRTSSPARARESELIKRVISDDQEFRMPPKGEPLSAKEIALRQGVDRRRADVGGGVHVQARDIRGSAEARAGRAAAARERPRPSDRPHRRRLLSDSNKVQPPQPLDDAAFIRRVYLDVIGLLPAPEELDAFLKDRAPDKRARLVRRLLDDKRAYADHWLTFWNDLLRNDYEGTGYIDGGRKQITAWLYQSLLDNKPYDRFVRELISPRPESEGFIKGIKWRGRVNASQVREVQFSQNVVAGVLRHQHEVRLVPRQLHRQLEAGRRLWPGGRDRRPAAGDAPLRQADRQDGVAAFPVPGTGRHRRQAAEGQAAGAAGRAW